MNNTNGQSVAIEEFLCAEAEPGFPAHRFRWIQAGCHGLLQGIGGKSDQSLV